MLVDLVRERGGCEVTVYQKDDRSWCPLFLLPGEQRLYAVRIQLQDLARDWRDLGNLARWLKRDLNVERFSVEMKELEVV